MESSSCDQQSNFVSVFLFPNGRPSCPEKLRLKRNEVCTFFTKTSKGYCYQGKSLYTLGGDLVTGFGVINESAGFVMVVPHDTFIPANYKQAFCAVSKKKSALKGCSRSAPSIPASNCGAKEPCDKRRGKKPQVQHAHFVTKDKYPCCDQNSDIFTPNPRSCDTPPAADGKKSKKKAKSRPKSKSQTQKKGFLASCCPCFVKKPKAKPVPSSAGCSSRPVSRARCNKKMTQTTPEDFKQAKKCLAAAIKEEKRRQKLAKAQSKTKPIDKCQEKNPCDGENKQRIKDEEAYRKARQAYAEKRRKMEEKLNKELERELKKKQKC